MEELERKIIILLSDNKPRIQNEIIDGIGMDHKPDAVRNKISRIFNKSSFLKIVKRAFNDNIQGKAWTLKDDAFKTLVTEFIGTPDTLEFFYSAYCQNMINYELVEKIKTEWDYPKNIEIEKGYRIPSQFNLIGENRPDIILEYGKGTVLTDEQVLDLLRESPSALRALISTGEKFESSRFDKIFILNVLLDLEKYHRKEGTQINLWTELKIKLQLIKKDEYLFSWDMIPGNDSARLIAFLKQNYNLDWVQTAKIDIIYEGKTIRIKNNEHFLSLNLNEETNDVSLQIDDVRIDKFIVKCENFKLNIYKYNGKKDILGKTFDMVTIQPANKIKSKELTSEEIINKMIELRENDTENFTLIGAGYY